MGSQMFCQYPQKQKVKFGGIGHGQLCRGNHEYIVGSRGVLQLRGLVPVL